MAATRILIVDDEAHMRNLIEMKLRGAGYEVKMAANAELGLEAARSFEPDLIVTDYEMPGAIDGLGLVQAVRNADTDSRIEPATPFVMVTGSVAINTKLREALGDDNRVEAISKPFSPRNLLKIVAEMLAKTRVQSETDSGESQSAIIGGSV